MKSNLGARHDVWPRPRPVPGAVHGSTVGQYMVGLSWQYMVVLWGGTRQRPGAPGAGPASGGPGGPGRVRCVGAFGFLPSWCP